MSRLICLLALLTTGLLLADDRADYDRLKVELQEQKRILNRYHSDRDYAEAISQQDLIAENSRKALDMALKSAEIGNAGAWEFHARMLRDVGLTEEALRAVDEYLKTPLLERAKQKNAWKMKAQIYRRAKDHSAAEAAYRKAISLADEAHERFNLTRDIAGLKLRDSKVSEAQALAQQLRTMLAEIEAKRQASAERSLQGLLIRSYRETGDAEAARAARFKLLELRKAQVEEELAEFDHKYPANP